jgi:hypothetical protein
MPLIPMASMLMMPLAPVPGAAHDSNDTPDARPAPARANEEVLIKPLRSVFITADFETRSQKSTPLPIGFWRFSEQTGRKMDYYRFFKGGTNDFVFTSAPSSCKILYNPK